MHFLSYGFTSQPLNSASNPLLYFEPTSYRSNTLSLFWAYLWSLDPSCCPLNPLAKLLFKNSIFVEIAVKTQFSLLFFDNLLSSSNSIKRSFTDLEPIERDNLLLRGIEPETHAARVLAATAPLSNTPSGREALTQGSDRLRTDDFRQIGRRAFNLK